MENLSESRKRMDEIDEQILSLYEERIKIATEIAEYKIENHRPVLDRRREDDKLAKLAASASDSFNKQGVEELFSQILSISRKKQYRLIAKHGLSKDIGFFPIDGVRENCKVVYQGVPGAYSQVATERFFGEDVDATNVETWRDAMEAINNGDADYAVLPMENSTAGIISENYDLLIEYQAFILGEQIIRVEHALLGLPDAEISDIDTVYSHPQALMQCSGYLRNTHPEFESRSLPNTAMAAMKVKDDNVKNKAAIAGAQNAKIYGLKVLENGIQDESINETRFIIVSPRQEYTKKSQNVSIAFYLPTDQSGALYNALSHFIFNGITMNRIESRPLRNKAWEYMFFIDFVGNLQDEAVINALQGLKEETEEFRILGTY